jgi:TRAP-type C4-dicarboxylate transport system substrate-binding protein
VKEKQSKGRLIIIGTIISVLLVLLLAPSLSCGEPETVTETVITTETSTSTETSTATETATTTETATETVKPITLVFTTSEAAGGIADTEYFTPWFSELEEKSGGRIKIEAHWSDELVKASDAYDALLKGIVDIADLHLSMFSTQFPMSEIMNFNSYDTEVDRRSRLFWELLQKFPEMQAEFEDIKVLSLVANRVSGFGTVSKPVRTLEDCKGLKLIATGKWDGARHDALGMTSVSLGPAEMFSSLQTGIVDGIDIALFGLRDFHLGELLHYVTLVPQAPTLLCAAMNLETWNSLPADIQQMMEGMTQDLIDAWDELQVRTDKERLASSPEEFGTEFITIPEEELVRWVEADRSVLEDLVAELESKGLPGEDLMNEYLQLEKKYATEEYAID